MSGFLPARGSLLLDVVVVAMLVVTVAMSVSIAAVRYRKNHSLHRKIQTSLAALLFLTLVVFEIDMRFFTRWQSLAEASPYYQSGWAHGSLYFHLCFAIPTIVVWFTLVVGGIRNYNRGFPDPEFRRKHRIAGRLGAFLMIMTTLTGWWFYWIAFVAS